jgi:hypothetical protein
MKTTILTCLCSFAIALSVFAQTPPVPPAPPSGTPGTSQATTTPATATTSISPVASPSATAEDEDWIHRTVARKMKHQHPFVSIDGHSDSDSEDLGALMAIPIVGIVFTTLFGAPVLIVGVIMFFSYWKARSLHRTVRLMVEKGQEVPAALFLNPPSAIRARSDMRRGVVLTMIGMGLIIFLAAMNGGFRGGEWSFGVIPLLIGAGYLLVWKLEGRKNGPPPLP